MGLDSSDNPNWRIDHENHHSIKRGHYALARRAWILFGLSYYLRWSLEALLKATGAGIGRTVENEDGKLNVPSCRVVT